MNIRNLNDNNEKHFKVVVKCDIKDCKQPDKEFFVLDWCKSVVNNYYLCPSCVQRQSKVRDKLVKSATNQWKTIRSKMIDGIRKGNSKLESSINKRKATNDAWNDPIKRESMLNSRKPGSKYYTSLLKTVRSKEFREHQSDVASNKILNGHNTHSN